MSQNKKKSYIILYETRGHELMNSSPKCQVDREGKSHNKCLCVPSAAVWNALAMTANNVHSGSILFSVKLRWKQYPWER